MVVLAVDDSRSMRHMVEQTLEADLKPGSPVTGWKPLKWPDNTSPTW